MYEVFEHTADLGLRMTAATQEELFAEAGRGLFSLVVADLSTVRLTTERKFSIPGDDRTFLFFDWLTELLYVFESEHLLLASFAVCFTPEGLSAVACGEPVDRNRHVLEHEVKAITYHGLKIESLDGGWSAEVIVDI